MWYISTILLNIKGMEMGKVILSDVTRACEDDQHSMMVLVTKQKGIYINTLSLAVSDNIVEEQVDRK